MITLSNGHSFEYLVASGALGFDGSGWPWEKPLIALGLIDPSLFTIVTKTTTYDPRPGNLKLYKPWTCIKPLKEGVINAVGLTNPGFAPWHAQYGRTVNLGKSRLIASINLEENIDRIIVMVQVLNDMRLVGVELNVSCPNFKHGNDVQEFQDRVEKTCDIIKKNSRHPLLIKLSCTHPKEFAQRLIPFAEAFDINSVPWNTVFRGKTSPLEKLGGGGVSGRVAQYHNWNFLSMLVKETAVPVIGCSVWEYDDIARLRKRGASAISFGAIHIPHPTWPTKFVKRDLQEQALAQKGTTLKNIQHA